MSEKRAHTIAEVVQISGAGRTTIYAEIAAQRLKAKKLGRRTLIMSDDLEAWLSNLPDLKSRAA
ncbi:Prophage CP4-57 regulatory [Methylobacterium sp. 4-46]|uniref:helix-turn-helix domain-containing protein n=1 Tax=unclassified Methylobacterium TaxID=2615210 RepID=UPI000152BEFB|nr:MULTISPECIES: helix-turn-helix domain-containing protein [Methylobacterium]ACA18347.1 Prophage CP4-57 regulatory [Methylobacterium sp. 4-46]WFT77643.1 helix-turn-helix domain-containing protein [Methylobacterium nodulans]